MRHSKVDVNARRLALFDERTLTGDYIAHAVTDHGCEPLIQSGEVAVITDEPHLYPDDGGWYLVEEAGGAGWRGIERRQRRIAMAIMGRGGEWWTCSPGPRQRGALGVMDGPYADPAMMAEKILGRVVGLYRPMGGPSQG